MAGIPLPVEATLDERTATSAANRAVQAFANAGRDAGQQFSRGFGSGSQQMDEDLRRIGRRASDTYDQARDAAGRLRAEEEKLQSLRERGARNDQIVSQAERVERARRAEIRAIRDATDAYGDYEKAASGAGERGGQSFLDGLRGATAGAGASGQDMANDFAGGFAGSSALLRLGAAGGPIGLALAGVATLGALAGRQLGQGLMDGLATLQMQDFFQGRMGLDEASMGQYASAAGQAFANNFGQSVADNLSTAQVALQSGLLDPSATDVEVQTVIQQLQGMTALTDASAAEVSRSITTLMRTGLADSVSEASDIIVAGFQGGLDISGDWLDTLNEYSTQFRKLGLDSGQVLTLLQQGLQGGARDTDKVADSLKEFSIRAVDGSKSTQEGFEALGFNAEEMGRRFAEGGDSAEVAFGAVLTALRNVDDPMQQSLIWTRLFGTQFEDMGDAINRFDLSKVSAEFSNIQGTTATSIDQMSEHVNQWDLLGRNIDQTFSKWKTWLADSSIGQFLTQGLPGFLNDTLTFDPRFNPNPTPPAPGTPVTQNPLLAPYQPSPNAAAPGVGTNPLDIFAPTQLPPGVTPVAPPEAPQQGTPTPIPVTPEEAGAEDKPSFDPSQFSLDSIPIGQFQGLSGNAMPGVPGLPAATGGPVAWNPRERAYGSYQVDPQRVFDAETAVINQQQSVESARVRLLELQADVNATQAELNAARTAVITSERGFLSAQQKLAEAQQGTWEKMESAANSFTSGMGEIGAALDPDFGISEGLPGIADNLVRFVASLAAAPLVGPLSAISAANGDQGSGLIGMAASNGMFGPQYMPGAGTVYSPTAMGPAALRPGAGYAGDAALLANVPAGRYSQTGNADLTQGLADCSSAVEDLVNIMDGRPTGGREMSTGNAAEWLTEHGFLPGAGGLGDMRVAFNAGHMQATLPGGTPFNWGSDAAAARGGIGGSGADDPALTSRYYRPAGAAPSRSPVSTSTTSTLPGLTPAPFDPSTQPIDLGGLPSFNPSDPALTNPGLTPPVGVPTGGIGLTGAPQGFGGPSLGQMTLGGPQGALAGAQAAMTPNAGGVAPGGGIGSGFAGISGAPMDALMGAAGMADMVAPGAGAAAQIGIKLLNRGVAQMGRYAGIGVSGLMETLLPAGSDLAGKSWFSRLAGGLSGARPALPNMAGGAGSAPGLQPPGPIDRGKAAVQAARGDTSINSGNTTHISVDATNRQQEGQGIARDIDFQLAASNAGVGHG